MSLSFIITTGLFMSRKRGESVHLLADKADSIKRKLEMFESRPSDYETAMKSTERLVSLIEEIEAFAVSGRKVIAGYQKELSYYEGMIDKKFVGKKSLYGIKKNVTVKTENNVVTLVMFPLIKNLSSKSKEYLSLLISDALKEYFSSHQKPDFNSSKCVLVINSLYARPEMIRDNDSVEVSAIINALKVHFLTDDDGLHLSIFRMGSMSERFETEIYLMRDSDFEEWLHKGKKLQETKEE